jgi:aldehyde:ferredoxin oxidoreductase
VEARETLKAKLGSSVRVAACGPAGENLVTFAGIIADNDASGSNGFGAVMGAKKLKAIAVKGSKKATAADPEKLDDLRRYVRELKTGFSTLHDERPTTDTEMKPDPCYGCIGGSGCIRATRATKDGKRHKFFCGSAVYYHEWSVRHYGEVNEVPFLATVLCDGYGLDVYPVHTIIAWLSRCYKAGILDDESIGIPISRLGSLEFIETLLRKITFKEGFGEILAQGLVKAADSVGQGSQELITDYVSKAGRITAYCPRMYPVSCLLYAMEPTLPMNQLHEVGIALFDWLNWANKVEGSYLSSEAFRKIAGRFWGGELAVDFSTYDGKALATTKIQDRAYAKESLILCDVLWPITQVRHSDDHVGDPGVESRLLSAVTGRDIDEQGLYRIGERVFNLQRAIHVREGHRGREDDVLPEPFYTKPLKFGTLNPECLAPGKDGEIISRKGAVVERERFEEMKDEYYPLRGWDVTTGLQTRRKLEELGLDEVAKDLEQRKLLAVS